MNNTKVTVQFKDSEPKDPDEEIKPSRLKQQKKTKEDREREEGRELLEAIIRAMTDRINR